ncbi:MAG: bifunctional oligoribonuclease/PAP phosphatase NrnA [Calditrichaeota bacterium]|nr:MAG: bifunctional oligoribonuclease/PAP phosphatase NrnA [Calditrichota bacterium]
MTDIAKVCNDILEFIDQHDNYLITTHLSADGDAYGSALAMAYFLESKSKQFTIVFHDQEKEEKYDYLWGWSLINPYCDEKDYHFDAAIIVDVPSRSRIGNPAQLLPSANHCIKIDHHPEEDELAILNLVDTAASSTCQLVYEIISRSDVEISHQLATLLFSGIMYDTGRFSFSNTRARDFEIAAHLTSLKVNPSEVANHLFFNNNVESFKIIGYGLSNIETFLNGKVCVIFLPYSVMQKAGQLDIEELTNYSLAVKGVEVGLFIRQVEPDFIKVSFRSKGKVDVNKVAKVFGGGGHVHAAGCRTNGDPLELRDKIIQEIEKQLP